MNDLPTDPDLLQDDEQEMFEHYRFEAEKGLTLLRVDKFITNRMEQTSRHRVQLAINAGYVLVNDRIVKANYKVKPLDVVTIMMPYQRRGFEVLPEPIPLNILYEDEDLLVINKPPDWWFIPVAVMPAALWSMDWPIIWAFLQIVNRVMKEWGYWFTG